MKTRIDEMTTLTTTTTQKIMTTYKLTDQYTWFRSPLALWHFEIQFRIVLLINFLHFFPLLNYMSDDNIYFYEANEAGHVFGFPSFG
jgi:hypothetical protein